MQYMLLIYDDPKIWNDMAKSEKDKYIAEYAQLTIDLKASGHHRAGGALQPTTTATSVRVRGGKTQTTDGPFAETKEQLGGYYLVEAANLDEAIKLAAKIPSSRLGTVEVRPLIDMSTRSSM